MSTSHPDPAANNTQLVRYSLQLPTMTEPDGVVAVREVLQQHHLIVDRVAAAEAIVTSATGTEPDWVTIKKALQVAGYPVAHTATVEE
ncbi:hypothetical protein [Hymenobacter lucidus]|uniref:Copper chaperone n=1 Tax=Hymenobacter lucidus TaxID=2880930 RepID=A0ABS8AXG8_9BACT|nr:hypothetical protein [Hymenobacter lucidus]MCB2410514.1 hypothetical protein [Hymenobacter lucidus]